MNCTPQETLFRWLLRLKSSNTSFHGPFPFFSVLAFLSVDSSYVVSGERSGSSSVLYQTLTLQFKPKFSLWSKNRDITLLSLRITCFAGERWLEGMWAKCSGYWQNLGDTRFMNFYRISFERYLDSISQRTIIFFPLIYVNDFHPTIYFKSSCTHILGAQGLPSYV